VDRSLSQSEPNDPLNHTKSHESTLQGLSSRKFLRLEVEALGAGLIDHGSTDSLDHNMEREDSFQSLMIVRFSFDVFLSSAS